MDTRRAPGTEALAPDVRAPASGSATLSLDGSGSPAIEQIAEALHHVLFLTDAGCTSVPFVNEAYERIFGRRRDELASDPLAFMRAVHPDDRARVLDAVRGRPGRGYDIEFRVVRPDGEVRWLWSRGIPVQDADGAVAWIVGTVEDTTDRKRVTASHEQLIRGFTHDVRNPLGAADGYLALLCEGVHGELSPAQLETVRHSRRCIRSAWISSRSCWTSSGRGRGPSSCTGSPSNSATSCAS